MVYASGLFRHGGKLCQDKPGHCQAMLIGKYKRKNRRFAAALIIMFIITGTVYPVADIFASEIPEGNRAADGEYTEIREINRVSDLTELSEKSVDESYTKGVRYVLTRDIDLSETDFQPVSIFAGVFDGQGHLIKGFSFSGRQEKTGFIRTVAPSGHIMNLNLKAKWSETPAQAPQPRGDGGAEAREPPAGRHSAWARGERGKAPGSLGAPPPK